ncbi:hypothetical protein [Parendozoicomonas haliclonae]|uniref:Uncharacterized protein n=1 Tax=Parendozoicomonas haliclonae TaxID=1960125 RepID=A0A1X7AGH1_9GAMM|nr:hypothetical protein [Parendozoicomonas haliclonae]SMA38175.1 hypothetical protein EHSB41UT_00848 [Parendozoicomonas haliclonae]
MFTIAMIVACAVLFTIWLWLTVLAVLCLILDPELTNIQRWGQSLIALLFPFLGAAFVLRLVKDHSPEVIARFRYPWPFNNLILEKPLRSGGTGNNGEVIPGAHGHNGGIVHHHDNN